MFACGKRAVNVCIPYSVTTCCGLAAAHHAVQACVRHPSLFPTIFSQPPGWPSEFSRATCHVLPPTAGHCHGICTDGCTTDAQCGAGYFCDTDVTQLCLATEGKGLPCVQVRLSSDVVRAALLTVQPIRIQASHVGSCTQVSRPERCSKLS